MRITQEVKSYIYEIAVEKELHLPSMISNFTKGRTNRIVELTLKEGKEFLKLIR